MFRLIMSIHERRSGNDQEQRYAPPSDIYSERFVGEYGPIGKERVVEMGDDDQDDGYGSHEIQVEQSGAFVDGL